MSQVPKEVVKALITFIREQKVNEVGLMLKHAVMEIEGESFSAGYAKGYKDALLYPETEEAEEAKAG